MMEELDFAQWVKRSENSAVTAFRQAVHTLMLAISQADSLQTRMIFHGGLLLAIRFQGIRHTKDIDFVTEDKRTQIDEDGFIASLNEAIKPCGGGLAAPGFRGLYCRLGDRRAQRRLALYGHPDLAYEDAEKGRRDRRPHRRQQVHPFLQGDG